ncbi:MAG: haloacid dehalogenase-like hydrolase [Acidobacteriota bacterium]
MKPALLLFDIDGTLVLTGRAGARAMARAFAEVFGVTEAFTGVSMAGRTDTWLVTTALARAGLPATPAALASFRTAYLAALAEEMHQPGSGPKGLLPGIEALLAAVAGVDGVHTALLTGNFQDGARIKLEYFAIWHRFAWGVFGDEALERVDLAPIATARARARVPAAARANTIVIGDTPLDVACGRAAGARVLAVATGGYSVDELAAAGADVVLPDLADTERVLAAL